MNARLKSAIPVLPARDVPQAVAFYQKRLGFSPLFEYGPYAGVARGPTSLASASRRRRQSARCSAETPASSSHERPRARGPMRPYEKESARSLFVMFALQACT
jgi:catechol 2,3-dioxygenase-like lactoylglutathione lyase family enzyme